MDFSSLGLGELDWVFVVIILLSTLLGASRGMVREIFALVGWVAAFFVSLYCSADLAAVLPFQAHMGLMTRTFVSIVLIVIGCVFLAGLVGKILRSILASVSIGAEDRLLGCLFGFCADCLSSVCWCFSAERQSSFPSSFGGKILRLCRHLRRASLGALLIFPTACLNYANNLNFNPRS